MEWNGRHLAVLGGLVWADVELSDFAHAGNHLCPTVAVAITPNAFLDPTSCPRQSDDCVLVDSAAFGSVRNQKWRLYIWGRLPDEFMQFAPMYRETRTLADAYRLTDINPLEDELGVVRIIPFGFAKGLTVFIECIAGKQYILSSHMPTLSMSSIRSGEPKRPKKRRTAMM